MLAYLKMLIVNRLAGLKPASHAKPGKGRAKAIWKIIGMALLALYVYAVVVFLEVLIYNTGKGLGEPALLVAVIFLGSTVVTLFYSFFYVIGTLFFGRDTSFLAALPITSRGIMSAKLMMVLAGEMGLTLLLAAPMLVRYGVDTGAGALFYVRALLGTLFVPLMPIALSTLLGCLLIRVSALWKRRESMTIVLSFAFMAAIIAFQMNLNANMTENQMSDWVLRLLFNKGSLTDTLLRAYPPMRWLVDGITGSGAASWGRLALFAAVSVAAMALVVLVFGSGYLRLALKQQESIRRANAVRRRLGADHVRKPFWALFRMEMREVITVPVYATNCLTGSVMFPVMIVFLLIGFQDRAQSFALVDELLRMVPTGYLVVILSGALSLTSVMGMAVSTAVSREGKQHDMRKTLPVSGFTFLSAKLLMGMCYNAVTTLFCAIALWVLLPSVWVQTLTGLAVSQLFSLLFSAGSLIWDTTHAKLQWKTETEAVKQNFNSLVSMLIGIGVLAALVGVFLLSTHLGLTVGLSFLLVVALAAAGDLFLLKWLRDKASVAYYLR